MKVVFLDIDGVLNIMSASYYSHRREYDGHKIEFHLLKRLEFLIERTGAMIVISSSWRNEDFVDYINNHHNFRYLDNIIGRTPRDKHARGDQIADWLVTHPEVKDYIILEDEISDVVINDELESARIVEVDMNEGLSHENVMYAVKKLNGITNTGKSDTYYSAYLVDKLIKCGYVLNNNPTILNESTEMHINHDDLIISFRNKKGK